MDAKTYIQRNLIPTTEKFHGITIMISAIFVDLDKTAKSSMVAEEELRKTFGTKQYQKTRANIVMVLE